MVVSQICIFFHPETLGFHGPIWRADYFSKGLVKNHQLVWHWASVLRQCLFVFFWVVNSRKLITKKVWLIVFFVWTGMIQGGILIATVWKLGLEERSADKKAMLVTKKPLSWICCSQLVGRWLRTYDYSHGNPSYPPQSYPPPRNKSLLRVY